MGVLSLSILARENQAPSSSGWLSLSLGYGVTHVFTLDNFTTETTPAYADPESDALEAIMITSIPIQGSLFLNGATPVLANDEISSADLSAGNLTYVTDSGDVDGYSDGYMLFLVSDVGSSTFTISPKTVTFVVEGNVNQSPSSVGNGELDISEGETVIFTRAMLTSQLNPPYEDPEGDIAGNLLVETVPIIGALYLNGVIVVDNQVIPFTSIDAGLFTYVNTGSPTGGNLEGFDFKISDVGSGEYRG